MSQNIIVRKSSMQEICEEEDRKVFAEIDRMIKESDSCKWKKNVYTHNHIIPHEANWAIYGLPNFCPECGKHVVEVE